MAGPGDPGFPDGSSRRSKAMNREPSQAARPGGKKFSLDSSGTSVYGPGLRSDKWEIPAWALASGGATMTITNVGYNQFVQNRAPKNKFRVVLNDGTVIPPVTVLSSAPIDASTEQITFTTTWPSTIQIADIKRVEIFEKVRLDSDDVSITHENALGQARINFPVKVVFE